MIRSVERFEADPADVGDVCDTVAHYLAEEGLSARETERLRLTTERLLTRIGERMGRRTPCELALGRRLGRMFIAVSYRGAAFDPTAIARESEADVWSARLLADLGLVPDWSWRAGVNRLTLRPRGRAGNCFIAPAAALALGALLSLLPDAAGREALGRAALASAELLCDAAGVSVSLSLFFSLLPRSSAARETPPPTRRRRVRCCGAFSRGRCSRRRWGPRSLRFCPARRFARRRRRLRRRRRRFCARLCRGTRLRRF